MKRPKTKSKQPRTKHLLTSLREWDEASKSLTRDINLRGKGMLDAKRMKLHLAQKQKREVLNKEFGRWLNQ